MSKERRLGRGLEALLGKVAAEQPDYIRRSDAPNGSDAPLSLYSGGEEEPSADAVLGEMLRDRPADKIPVDLIDANPFQPRRDFDAAELTALSESLTEHGLLQPIVVRKKGDRYELIAGERRLRAAQQAGWSEIPAHAWVVDDREMAELALTENIQRKDLNAIEKAVAFKNYIETYGGTQIDIARRLNLDRSTVSNLMRLLELPEELQASVRRGELTQGHVRALLSLEESDQFQIASRIVDEGWSVRQTESYVQDLSSGAAERSPDDVLPPGPKEPAARQSAHLLDLQQRFSTLFGTKVRLTSNEKGKGKLVIPFGSAAEFERIFQLIVSRLK